MGYHTNATLAGSKYGPREADYRNCGMLNCNVLQYGIRFAQYLRCDI